MSEDDEAIEIMIDFVRRHWEKLGYEMEEESVEAARAYMNTMIEPTNKGETMSDESHDPCGCVHRMVEEVVECYNHTKRRERRDRIIVLVGTLRMLGTSNPFGLTELLLLLDEEFGNPMLMIPPK